MSGLSPVEIDFETARFWIDKPDAVNRRCALFAKLPTIVHVVGYRLGECRGLASLIDTWWGEKFDVYGIDDWYTGSVEKISIHPLTDIFIVDTAELYSMAVKCREESGRTLRTKILFVNADPDLTPIVHPNVYVLKSSQEALRWVARHQIDKVTQEMEERLSQFVL